MLLSPLGVTLEGIMCSVVCVRMGLRLSTAIVQIYDCMLKHGCG